MGRLIYTYIYRSIKMKTEISLKPYKFIVSVEFDGYEKLTDEEVKTVLHDKLRGKTKVFKDIEILWRIK